MSAIEHEFQVGDAIQFKDWQELIDEFGKNRLGRPKDVPGGFNIQMRYLCGQVAHIKSIDSGRPNFIRTVEEIEDDKVHHRRWFISTAMIKPYEECETEEVDADSFISMIQF